MLPISPLEYLVAFAIAFLAGALWSTCFCRYASRIRREAPTDSFKATTASYRPLNDTSAESVTSSYAKADLNTGADFENAANIDAVVGGLSSSGIARVSGAGVVGSGSPLSGSVSDGFRVPSEHSSSEQTAVEGTSARLAEDSPAVSDELGFRDYAVAIARFLTHSDSRPPLTISIQAPWGGGKTTLMLLIEQALDPYKRRLKEAVKSTETTGTGALSGRSENKESRSGAPWWSKLSEFFAQFRAPASDWLSVGDVEHELSGRRRASDEGPLPKIPPAANGSEKLATSRYRVTVWFNAWKYESTNQVWAGLVDAILQQVPERLSAKERELFWLRLNVSRIGVDQVRQRLHEHLLDLTLRSATGTLRALLVAALTCAAIFGLNHHGFLLSTGGAAFRWTFSLTGGGTFAIFKAIFAKLDFKSEPARDVVKNLVDVPKYEQELGFVHQVERDLRRVFDSLPGKESLVIFIDDLDRCSPSKVAAVLEAVNLFLAGSFPRCSFVVGMDSEMVAAALQAAHKDLTANLPGDARTPVGWRFMDKFVQLPFVIPPLAKEDYERLMSSLLGGHSDVPRSNLRVKEDIKPHTAGDSLIYGTADDRGEGGTDSDVFKSLVLEVSRLLDNNPRELKRFINLFRFNYFLRSSREKRKLPVPAPVALARWSALCVRWPEHVRWLYRASNRNIAPDKLKGVFGGKEDIALWKQTPSPILILEKIAQTCMEAEKDSAKFGIEEWQDTISDVYQLDKESVLWLSDRALLDFYMQPFVLEDSQQQLLGRFVNTGFW
ncbi:KAP family P-loop domain protein [Paraburkholderia xenovorans LB400]|nr:P-loop NTPase fold protein [Paraburkholderia xenovorans]AIP37764.1 KAP family P-loop domain protein [Paraburkholderia xenovorans LB400]